MANAAENNPHRLPRTVRPRRYDLRLVPDLDHARYSGEVDVEVDVVEATDEVVLNAMELEIDDAWVTGSDGGRLAAAVTLDTSSQRATLSLDQPLGAGEAVVSLRFRGRLNDKLRGFYRSTFTDRAGQPRVIATTQFEATDARRAFPCWDEPDLKAVFAITLDIDPELTAVSNAAVLSEEDVEGLRRVRFADTMPLSTYLVAFVIGPLESTEPIDVDGTPLRVLAPPGKLHLAPFGLEVAEFALRYLADYFDIPYAGDSMDLVAIPDFAFGAMENLGCVTFRETLLLADPAHSTQSELQSIVDVVGHELAHMWFGDLVTMRWWNGIWLNEAFATFMELKVTDALRPEWQRWVRFGLSRSSAFDTDALESSRPIEFPVVSPADAEGMFDVLTYEKGAAVVRMLEQYLGEERFRDGIRRYMSLHEHGNTETTDLWDAIEEVSGEPVRRIMDSWIFQGGHPLVSVDTAADGRVLRLSQERMLYLPRPDGDERWAVPMHLRYQLEGAEPTVTTVLLDGGSLELDLPAPLQWVVANAEGHGFYRVHYSTPLREALIDRLPELSHLERYGLVDDTWAAVLSGAATGAEFLRLAEGSGDETHIAVWRRVLGGLDQLERIIDGDDASAAFAGRVRDLLAPALERLGWEPRPDDSDGERELRAALIGALAVLGRDSDARARVAELFAAYRSDPDSIEANVAAAVVRATASLAGPAEVDALIDGFRHGSTPQEELRYLYALSEVRDRDQMARVLDLAMTPEVRTQNAPFLIGACVANRDCGDLAWATVHRRWEEMNERFPSNSIVRMLHGIRSVHDPALAAEIEAFVSEHPVPQAKQTLAQHLERMRVSVALHQRESTSLSESLERS